MPWEPSWKSIKTIGEEKKYKDPNNIPPVDFPNIQRQHSVLSAVMHNLLEIEYDAPQGTSSLFAVKGYPENYKGRHDRTAEAAMQELNGYELQLRQALGHDGGGPLTPAEENTRVSKNINQMVGCLKNFFSQPRDLNDPLVAELYQLQENVTLAEGMCQNCHELSTTNEKLFPKYRKALGYLNVNEVEDGFLPLSGNEQVEYDKLAGDYNAIQSDMKRHLTQQYEIFLNKLGEKEKKNYDALVTTAQAEQDSRQRQDARDKLQELQDNFEADYYRKYQEYQQDSQAKQALISHLKNRINGDIKKAAYFPTALKGSLQNIDENTVFHAEDQAAILALLDPVKPPKTAKEFYDKMLLFVNADKSIRESMFDALFRNHLVERSLQLSNTQADYDFATWQEYRAQQENSLQNLAKFRTGVAKGRVTDLSGAVYSATNNAFLEARDKQDLPFFDSVNKQLQSLRHELEPISTRVGGNSPKFEALLTTVENLRKWDGPGRLPSLQQIKDAKDSLFGNLNDVIGKADAYMKAKREQKGVKEGEEPSFHTTQGKKRYEYAKKIMAIAQKMRNVLEAAQVEMKDSNKVYEHMAKTLTSEKLDSFQDMYSSHMDQYNIPKQVDDAKSSYYCKLNYFDYGMSKSNADKLKKNIPENISEKVAQGEDVTNDLFTLENYSKFYLDQKEAHTLGKNRGLKQKETEMQDPNITLSDFCEAANEKLNKSELGIFKITQKEHENNQQRLKLSYTQREKQRDPKEYLKAVQKQNQPAPQEKKPVPKQQQVQKSKGFIPS